jgi:hypothetical protein
MKNTLSLAPPPIRRSPISYDRHWQSNNGDCAKDGCANGDGQYELEKNHDEAERKHVPPGQRVRVIPDGVVRKS